MSHGRTMSRRRVIQLAGTTLAVGGFSGLAAADAEETSSLAIDRHDVSDRESGPWQRATSEWEVSDDEGGLDTVTSELLADGEVLKSETTTLGGDDDAAGTHDELRSRDGGEEVRLTVTNEDGATEVSTESLTEDDDDEGEAVSVETGEATDVGETSATVGGEVTDLDGAAEVDIGFEFGADGDLSNSVDAGTVDSAGSFEATVKDVDPDTEFEFRAVAEAGEASDDGTTQTFTTDKAEDDDDDDNGELDVRIEALEVTTGSPRCTLTFDWRVVAKNGDLFNAQIRITTDSVQRDRITSESLEVDGREASGVTEIRLRGEDADDAGVWNFAVEGESDDGEADGEAERGIIDGC